MHIECKWYLECMLSVTIVCVLYSAVETNSSLISLYYLFHYMMLKRQVTSHCKKPNIIAVYLYDINVQNDFNIHDNMLYNLLLTHMPYKV